MRIVRAKVGAAIPRGLCASVGAVGPGVRADLPRRPMAGHGVLLEVRDLGVAHAIEIVVGGIVLAHVIDAKREVLAIASAPFRSAMRSRPAAPLPLARRVLPRCRLFGFALRRDAD